MKKITLFLILTLFSIYSYTQDLVYEYQNGKQYCTIEIDTTNVGFKGSLKALDCYKVPYYEMVFDPVIDFNSEGELILTAIPRWHYYAFLEKVYGEIEKAQTDPKFKITFRINNENNTLEYISTQEEKDYVVNKTSYSNLKYMNFTKLPRNLSRTNELKVDYKKYPKDLQKRIQDRNNRLKARINQQTASDASLFEPVKPYLPSSGQKLQDADVDNNEFE